MTQEKQGIEDEAAAELVSSLLAEAPSAAFVLVKVGADGKKKNVPLRIQLLRQEEELACLARAQATAKKFGEVSKEYGDIYKEAQTSELLSKAIRHDKKRPLGDTGKQYYPQVFVDATQLRESFTANEICLCLNAYEVVKAQFSCVENFNPEELDKWAARLSDTLLGPFFLQRLDSSHWPELMGALALEVQALRAEVSRPLPSLRDSSESSQESSGSGTGGSSSSPTEQLTDSSGNPIPSDRLLDKASALEIAKKRREPDK